MKRFKIIIEIQLLSNHEVNVVLATDIKESKGQYIHLINQARGPFWENINPRS